MKKIAVIGGGYVGLVTAACFAKFNNKVFLIEKNESKLESLKSGAVPFYEPGLDELVIEGVNSEKLIFTSSLVNIIAENIDAFFICVGTPPKSDGSPNLSYVWEVASEIGKLITYNTVVINKSTVPVGTAKNVLSIINQHLKVRNLNIDIEVASNPEFLKEGSAIEDFLKPDRVIIGSNSKQAKETLISLYLPITNDSSKILVMNPESAELTKYGSNALLATKISFMNQLAQLAEKVNADIKQVQMGIGSDKRIGKDFLNAGVGYGGSCFPKDIQALIDMGKQNYSPMTLVAEVDLINQNQHKYFINKILNHYDGNISNKKVALWGLSFKPETDDIRCAPSIEIINSLLSHGALIKVYDPVATKNIQEIFSNKIEYATSACDALVGCNFLIIATEWKEFLNKTAQDFSVLLDKVIFDGRNCIDPFLIESNGINYIGIGRITHSAKLDKDLFFKSTFKSIDMPLN